MLWLQRWWQFRGISAAFRSEFCLKNIERLCRRGRWPHTCSAQYWPSSSFIVWLLKVTFCSWRALTLHITLLFIFSFFPQLYLTSDLQTFQKVNTIHTMIQCFPSVNSHCLSLVVSYCCQSHIKTITFQVRTTVPSARSELGCWQFLPILVEGHTLWPSGEAWAPRSTRQCKLWLRRPGANTTWQLFRLITVFVQKTPLRWVSCVIISCLFIFFIFQANEKVLIIHCKTNQALAALGHQVLRYFPFYFWNSLKPQGKVWYTCVKLMCQHLHNITNMF